LTLILAAVLGYLLGSIPAAYLIVRWKTQVDLRKAGSGNVGTLNSFEVTRSRLVGISVLLIDLAKGGLAVLLAGVLLPSAGFESKAVAGICAVAGHNFPVWLRFRGGRGLAPAAGVALVLQWLIVAAWGAGWGAGFLLTRRVNPGNVIASLIVMLLAILLPDSTIAALLPDGATMNAFRIFTVVLLTVILLKHIEPVIQWIAEKRGKVISK
jgi:glycerol-3-phosphate acyltransferase PlsY